MPNGTLYRWRTGTKGKLKAGFAAVRVRVASFAACRNVWEQVLLFGRWVARIEGGIADDEDLSALQIAGIAQGQIERFNVGWKPIDGKQRTRRRPSALRRMNTLGLVCRVSSPSFASTASKRATVSTSADGAASTSPLVRWPRSISVRLRSVTTGTASELEIGIGSAMMSPPDRVNDT
jgi:hypothetical protein